MNRTIKTRETVISVKTADHKKNLSHYMKQSSIRSKREETRKKDDPQAGASNYAIEDIQTTWKRSVYESQYRIRNRRRILRRDLPYGKQPASSSVSPSQASIPRRVIHAVGNTYQVQMVRQAIHQYAESFRNYNRVTAAISRTFTVAGSVFTKSIHTVKTAANSISLLFSAGTGILLVLTMTLFFGVFSSFTNTTVFAQGIEIPEASVQPDFTNEEAWGDNNPYTRLGFVGQCTWFAWGRFYEIYGYDPGFRGDGWNCAAQLVAAHPDKFELSYIPAGGAVFSTIGHNHVGIVISVDGDNITIQEGNLDGKSNPIAEAITDWHEITYSLDFFIAHNGGVIYAIPIKEGAVTDKTQP